MELFGKSLLVKSLILAGISIVALFLIGFLKISYKYSNTHSSRVISLLVMFIFIILAAATMIWGISINN